MKRLFIAAEIPADVRLLAAGRISELRKLHPLVRASWPKPENLHITIKFLGDTDGPLVPKLNDALGAAASGFGPLPLSVGSPSAFGRRVLAIDITDTDRKLSRLHDEIENACFGLGFSREERRFRPHLTLARIRDDKGARPLVQDHLQSEIAHIAFEVNTVALFESHLGPKGSTYEPIGTYSL